MQGQLFSAEHQEAIAQKLKPFLAQYAERLRPTFDTLADQSPTARELFQQLVSELPARKQAEYEGRLLQFLPIAEHPPLDTLDKESQLFLLKLYRTEVTSSPRAIEQILQATHSRYKEVATSASQELCDLLGEQLSLAAMIELMRSRFPGVRVNELTAIAQMTDRGKALQATELSEIAIALKHEDNQAIVCLWSELAANWVQTYRQVSPDVADAIGGSLARLVQKNLLEGESSRMLAALKAIAQSGAESTIEIQSLKEWTVLLLTNIDLIRVINSEPEVVDLLCALHRLDATFIVDLVEQECSVFSKRRWWKNIAPILKAVRRIDQVRSPLFDRVLSSKWCTSEIEGMILEI